MHPAGELSLNRTGAREGGILPHMGTTGICGPKGFGFRAVFVEKRVLMKTIVV